MRAIAGLFAALVARHASRHLGRTLLTVASVAVGVAAVVAVAVANENAIASFEGSAAYVSGGAAIELADNGAGLPDALIRRVRTVPGVADASGEIDGSVTVPASKQAYDLVGVDILAALGLAEGSAPTADMRGVRFSGRIFERGAVVMSASLSRRLSAPLGASLDLLAGVKPVRLFVAGVVDDNLMPLGARGALFCDLSTAQETFGKIGLVDRIGIDVRSGADVERVRGAVAAAVPAGVRVERPSDRATTIAKMTDAFRFNLGALAAIALLVAAYLVFNAVSMSVVQRRAEIGIARAVGATRGSIFAVFLLEGCAVGAAGSAAGIGLGLLLAGSTLRVVSTTIDQLYAGTVPLGWSVPLSVYAAAASVGIGTALAASFLPALEAAAVAPSIAVRVGSWDRSVRASIPRLTAGAVAVFVVAWLLARMPPIDGRPWAGYASALAVIAGCSLLAPPAVWACARLARRLLPASAGAAARLAPMNLSGRVRRNAVAVASLMVGVAMTVSVSTMIASFRESVQTWIGATLRGDLFVRPAGAVNADDVPMPEGLARVAARVPGVAAVDVIRTKLISYAGAPAYIGASDMRVTAERGYLPLLSGEWRRTGESLIGTSNALVSEPFARKFAVSPGDTITVDGAHGPAQLHVVGIYEDYSSDTGFVFVDIGTYRRIIGHDGIDGFAIYAQPGVDIPTLRGRVHAALGDARVAVQTNAELRANALAQFDRTFAVTSVLDAIAVAVSIMGVIATLAALVLERTREIGIMRCLGMLRRHVTAMIVMEGSLLGLMGAAMGVAAGYALAAILVYVINPQAFGWTIGFRPTPGYDVAVVAGITLTAALAGSVVAVRAARIDVAAALRTE